MSIHFTRVVFLVVTAAHRGAVKLYFVLCICASSFTFNTRSYEFICWIANEYQRINQVRMALFLSGDIHEGI